LRYAFGAICSSVAVQVALLPFLIVYFIDSRLLRSAEHLRQLLMGALAFVAAASLLVAQLSSTLAAPLISMTTL